MKQATAQRLAAAEWLELSGMPLLLNQARAGGWSVYKKLIELDCLQNEAPGEIQVAPEELARRCGYSVEQLEKIIEALRKKKALRAYWPDHPAEPGLFELIVPAPAPIAPEKLLRELPPLYRHPGALRYVEAQPATPLDSSKVSVVVDLYLHHLSQKMNSFVLEQIEHAVRRFPLDSIRQVIERAERHNLRNFGWVLKELYKTEQRRS